jgi:hypothetical protein
METREIQERIEQAAFRLQFDHCKSGGWRPRYGGYLDEGDANFPGYVGPFVWSEVDLQHRFATRLRSPSSNRPGCNWCRRHQDPAPFAKRFRQSV